MKVLVLAVATYADPATRRLFDRIAERGIDVLLAMPRRIRHPFGPAEVPETPWPTPGVRLERLDTWYTHENGTHVVMKGIPRLIREFRPDVIHCVMEPWSITCLQVLATLGRLPGRRPKFGVQSGESKPEQGAAAAAFIRRMLYRRVWSTCDYFIGWSGPVLAGAERLGLNGLPVATAPAVGIDTDLFRPAVGEERFCSRQEIRIDAPDAFLVGYAGRFVEEKGIRDLVAAMDIVISSVPSARLAMLGDGPLLEWLRSAAASRPWLTLVPRRDQAGVARFMRALDVLALPTLTTPGGEEQFGLAAAEAMATCVPVVGSSSGAIPEVVGEGGWVHPERDPKAQAAALLAAADPSSASDRGRAGREKAVRCYSDAAVAGAVTKIWGIAR